jgi:glycosyltransferase involved in cell wall biosynthesis
MNAGGVPAPRVLALVPTWKSADFVERTLDALAAQTYPDFEVLISDDASPDDTAAVCERRALRDARFRVIRQPRNLGWVGNVNALLREAEGRADYLLFAFQDDLPEPTYVEKCVIALEADPSAVLAFSDIRLVRQDGSAEDRSFVRLDGIRDRAERACRLARHQGAWWIPNRGVFRASAASAIGGLRRHREGEFSADWPWLIEMSLLGGFVRIPEKLVTKIYVPGSLSRTWKFGARQWAAAAASAMKAVSRRRLSLREQARVRAAIAAFVLKQWRRSGRRERDTPGDAGRPTIPSLVSIVMPVHGRFELAERAIRSVADQAYRPIELIVVDDASSPGFTLPARTYDFDARVLRQSAHLGPGASRDAGRRAARGEYVAYLDSDDFWAPTHLEFLVETLRERPEAGMAYSTAMEVRGGQPPTPRRWSGESCTEILPTLLWRRPWHTSACLWRRSVDDSTRGWLPIWHWEDHEHDSRAGILGVKLVPIARSTCFVEVESPERLSASTAMHRRIEGYVLAMLSIARRIRSSGWYADATVRKRMRDILLTAAIRAAEHRHVDLVARAAFQSWRWPAPSVRLVLATAVGVPLATFAGRLSARIFRWARDAAQGA